VLVVQPHWTKIMEITRDSNSFVALLKRNEWINTFLLYYLHGVAYPASASFTHHYLDSAFFCRSLKKVGPNF
jgi:hypothetical protein